VQATLSYAEYPDAGSRDSRGLTLSAKSFTPPCKTTTWPRVECRADGASTTVFLLRQRMKKPPDTKKPIRRGGVATDSGASELRLILTRGHMHDDQTPTGAQSTQAGQKAPAHLLINTIGLSELSVTRACLPTGQILPTFTLIPRIAVRWHFTPPARSS